MKLIDGCATGRGARVSVAQSEIGFHAVMRRRGYTLRLIPSRTSNSFGTGLMGRCEAININKKRGSGLGFRAMEFASSLIQALF